MERASPWMSLRFPFHPTPRIRLRVVLPYLNLRIRYLTASFHGDPKLSTIESLVPFSFERQGQFPRISTSASAPFSSFCGRIGHQGSFVLSWPTPSLSSLAAPHARTSVCVKVTPYLSCYYRPSNSSRELDSKQKRRGRHMNNQGKVVAILLNDFGDFDHFERQGNI